MEQTDQDKVPEKVKGKKRTIFKICKKKLISKLIKSSFLLYNIKTT